MSRYCGVSGVDGNVIMITKLVIQFVINSEWYNLISRSPVSLSLHEKPIIDFLTNKVTGFNTEGFILNISKA